MSYHPPDAKRYFGLRKILWRVRITGVLRLSLMMRRRIMRPAWYGSMMLWAVGCTLSAANVPPTATPLPTATPAPASAGWATLAAGFERRTFNPPNSLFAQLTAIRIDPTQVDLRVHYQPGSPLFIDGWQNQLPEATVIVNANFFDSTDRITGMLFADGVQYGSPYQRRGGTFFIQDGVPTIQSNLVQPYAGEQYQQAAQAFPMLVTNGAQSYFDTRADRPTRRSIVAVDAQGRVIILVTTFGGITLLDLAQYLITTDMGIMDALNLDGGGSSMLGVRAGALNSSLSSFDPVPAVIAVYPR